MDFQDWLIVIGVVVVLGILLDGFRRMSLARKDSLKMSRNMMGDIDTSSLDDDYNPELPGGGARVVQKEMDYDEPLVDNGPSAFERTEPVFGSEDSDNNSGGSGASESAAESSALGQEEMSEPVVAESDVSDSLSASVDDRPVSVGSFGADHAQQEKVKKSSKSARKPSSKSARKSGTKKVAEPELQENDLEQEVIVINVDSKPNTQFNGADIKKLLEACGLDHGDMSIFHRHEEDDLLSPIQFSVANAVEPGYFDPDQMNSIATPGVSFFMSLPGPKDYMKAFEYMLETAQCFASNLQGELKDERRSVLTPQTIEHCKQRVRDFERKQLSRVRA